MLNLATFEVSITNNFTGDAPADGFVDYKNSNQYITFDATGQVTGRPASLDNGKAKARAFYRYKQIINICGFSVNILKLTNQATEGADADTAPTKITFTIVYDKPSYLRTDDELNAGAQLTGADCVKRWIARALSNQYESMELIFDPTPSTVNAYIVRGPITDDLIVGSLGDISTIESNITVTLSGVDNTAVEDAVNNIVEY